MDIKTKVSELVRHNDVQDEPYNELTEALRLLLFIESRGELTELLHKMRMQAHHPRAKVPPARIDYKY